MAVARLGETAFDLAGPAGAPAVVLVHGLGLNRRLWRDHVPVLAERHLVLTYDLLGHGESGPPSRPPSLSLLADQLALLLDDLGIARAAMVGFSLGGMVVRRLALDRPERITALAILNSPHRRSPEEQRLVEARAARAAAGGPAATLDAAIERWLTPAYRRARPDVEAMVRGWVLANDAGVYARWRGVLASGISELIAPAQPFAGPALVMTCADDSGSSPAMAAAIAAELPAARLVVVPGLRHLGLMEEPAAFLGPLLDLLDRAGHSAS